MTKKPTTKTKKTEKAATKTESTPGKVEKSAAKSEAKPGPKTEAKPEPKPAPKPELKPENKGASRATPETRAAGEQTVSSPVTPLAKPAAAPPAPKSGGGAVFGAVMTILILGLAGAGAWVSRDHWWAHVAPYLPQAENTQTAQMLARMSAIEDQIAGMAPTSDDAESVAFAELQQERDALTAEISTIMARLEAVEQSLGGVERLANAVTVDEEAGIARDSIRELADRLASLELADNAGAEANIQFDSMLERLQSVEDQAKAMESAAADDMAVLASVQSKIDALETRPVSGSGNAGAAALVLGVGQLRDAVRRGAPYQEDMEALSTAMSEVADAPAYLQTLQEHASSGVPTLLQLQQSFSDVADAAFDASDPPVDDGWLSQTLHQLKSIVRIRDTDASASPGSVESRIARAENNLSAGDLAGAVNVLVELEGVAVAALSDWLSAAQARLAVDDALARLHTLVINRMMAQTSASQAAAGQE